MEILVTLLGGISLLLVVILYGSFSWGFVTYTFYNWFVLTSIPELPVFSLVQFIGFNIFINAFIRSSPSYIKDEHKEKVTEYTMTILGPWIILCLGWFVKVIIF
jgi:hypothetical protein